MKFGLRITLLVLLLALGAWLWHRSQNDTRRAGLLLLEELNTVIHTGDANGLRRLVVIPSAMQSRTGPEQTEFLIKSLQGEISPEGLNVLRNQGTFGALTNLFPLECARWATQAGVAPEDCVAFRMERGDVRAEVVLVRAVPEAKSSRQKKAYRIVRCNNVSQLAAYK